jgi:hypothetical protein
MDAGQYELQLLRTHGHAAFQNAKAEPTYQYLCVELDGPRPSRDTFMQVFGTLCL